MKKYYNIYRIEKETNDLSNVYGSENTKEIAEYLQINYKHITMYSTDSIEKAPKQEKILNNKHYIIIYEND